MRGLRNPLRALFYRRLSLGWDAVPLAAQRRLNPLADWVDWLERSLVEALLAARLVVWAVCSAAGCSMRF